MSRKPSNLKFILRTHFRAVRSMLDSFLLSMTQEQWTLIESDCLDQPVKLLVADLLLNITQTITASLLFIQCGTTEKVSVETVQNTLGCAISNSFSLTLGEDVASSVHAELLIRLMHQDVAEGVSSALSSSNITGEAHITTPFDRLDAMVQLACQMIKRMKRRCLRVKPCTTPVPLELVSGDNFINQTNNVKKLINIEVSQIVPFSDRTTESEDWLLNLESSSETISEVNKIAQLVDKSFRCRDASGPYYEMLSKLRTAIESEIKTFFLKLNVRALLFSRLAQMKTHFQKDREGRGRKELQSIIDDIESWILTKDTVGSGSDQAGIADLEVVTKFSDLLFTYIRQKPVENRTLDLYREIQFKVKTLLVLMSWWLQSLADSHSKRLTQGLMQSAGITEPPAAQKTEPCEKANDTGPASESDHSIFDDEDDVVSESDVYTTKSEESESEKSIAHKTELCISQSVSRATCANPHTTPEHLKPEHNKDKSVLKMIVENFVFKAHRKAKSKCSTSEQHAIAERLLKSVWATVKANNIVITLNMIKHLHTDVFHQLCKNISARTLILALMFKEQEIDSIVVEAFRDHLTSPKKHKSIWKILGQLVVCDMVCAKTPSWSLMGQKWFQTNILKFF